MNIPPQQRRYSLKSLNSLQSLAIAALATSITAYAPHARAAVLIDPALDVLGLRPAMSNEGLLECKLNPLAPGGVPRFGWEYTGWVDVRSPSLPGPADTTQGYDRSDHLISAVPTILKDKNDVVAADDRITDFEHDNKAFMIQAGTSL